MTVYEELAKMEMEIEAFWAFLLHAKFCELCLDHRMLMVPVFAFLL